MRCKLFPLFVIILVCAFSAAAQTVVESESRLVITEKTADLSLMIESKATTDSQLDLRILDPSGVLSASAHQTVRLRPGKRIHTISIPLGDLIKKADKEIAWYRLEYTVGDATGIVSISELMKDIFELRAAVTDNVFPGMNYRVRVRTIHPFTKQPVKGVQIDGDLELDLDTDADEDELHLKAVAKTNGDGFAVLDFKIPADTKLDDDGDIKLTARKNGIVREIDEDLDSDSEKGFALFTTDKPLYQPGQEFHIRGLFLDQGHTVQPDKEMEFKVYDEDDTVLYRETVKTSAYGIASIGWKIPENAKLGEYYVDVEDCNSCRTKFRVSRYDIPNFTVSAVPDKAFYLLNDKQAAITVKADYLFGRAVNRGKVRIVQESDRHWNWREQKYDVDEGETVEGDTDADGKFTAKVDLSDELAEMSQRTWQRFRDVSFAAYFTDLSTNRTEQRRFDIRLTKEPIHIYLMEYADQSPALPVTAYLSTFYADGTPANCEVEVTGNYENVFKREELARIRTNRFGAGKVQFSLPEKKGSNSFQMHIIARDKNGQAGTFDEDIALDDDDILKISTEKAIYLPGENINVNLVSTQERGFVYVDLVKDFNVLQSYFVELKKGKASLSIPYDPKFKGDLTISAYGDDKEHYYYSKMRANRGIIFPAQENLRLNAKFSSATYRPNEEASVKFSVLNGIGQTVESALGVVVFDKAIEERAKTDASFGSYFSRYDSLLGYGKAFGNISLKDLNDLDTSKPISPEMQLAAEVMLAGNYYYPNVYHSEYNQTAAKSLYGDALKKAMAPVALALQRQFEKDGSPPTDMDSLRRILSENGIDFAGLKDPWGQQYSPIFSVDKTQDIVTLKTMGPDKKLNTEDDFDVSSLSFSYFTRTGEIIEKAILGYHQSTGKYIRDLPTLTTLLADKGIDPSKLKDRWGRDYRITFEVAGRSYLVRFYSIGPDGVYEDREKNWRTDDFDVWKTYVDYFYETENRINLIFSQRVNVGKKPFPKDTVEFQNVLDDNGLEFDSILDGYSRPAYLTTVVQTVYADKTTVENGKQKITPVTNEIVTFHLRSKGEDGITDTRDDFDLATFSSVTAESSKDTFYSKSEVQNFAYSGANGAIKGTVVDPAGAVIAGAKVIAANEGDTTKTYETQTNENGEYLLENLPSGKYSVTVTSPGFQAYKQMSITVRSQNLVQMSVLLRPGAVSETVTVTAEALTSVNASSSSISKTITTSSAKISFPYANQNSTPRLRQYFPETLFWNPELITDKKGRAELKFRLADNITTWKMYTIASTKNGKVGVAEKEMRAFQPFFVDLDPPKFLTEGDEIYLPSQVRNYTDKQQKVDVTMAKSDWFSMLGSEKQQIDVKAGDSQNAVFGFKATESVKDGKQRVTAIAESDSDAIEKPVTVRPNGQEVVHADSNLFTGEEKLNLTFPANALSKTEKAELKIYPNLYSQISESVEGLLERPYGCGEQTISSTYPNLMVLKFVKPDSALAAKAKRYLQKGYERLIGYQVADGGFSYWGGKDTSDIGLTAYALRFLTDASSKIDVDPDVIKKAEAWLLKQQRADGGWTQKYRWENNDDPSRAKITTTYVARSLTMLHTLQKPAQSKGLDSTDTRAAALTKALAYLKTRNAEIDEPYALALFGLASLDAGDGQTAASVVKSLESMAIAEGNSVYWKLETNTPFYGWGTAGRVETTALVTQLLIHMNQKDPSAERQSLISKGTLFLLKNKDRYGVWYSTQTTINVLDAFLATIGTERAAESQKIDVFLNGEQFKSLDVAPDRFEAVTLDLTSKLGSSNNIEVRSSGSSPVMSQLVASHYIDWKDSDATNINVSQSRALSLDYKCDKTSAAIMQEVNCSVKAERIGFKGYGMLLAEIGTPPGADVSRESLENAVESDWSISHYEILPDRIVVYMWSKAGGTSFNFKFHPRFGINAQTPASVVYDYYNPEAQAIVEPLRFIVK